MKTKTVKIGSKVIGGGNPILIQSMTNTKTEDIAATVAQINKLAAAGCDIIRCAVPTMEAAEALTEIKKQVEIPVVADIHFDYRLAIAAIEHGADKIRINPGNIGSRERVQAVVDAAKERQIPIRVGVNSGSLEKDILIENVYYEGRKNKKQEIFESFLLDSGCEFLNTYRSIEDRPSLSPDKFFKKLEVLEKTLALEGKKIAIPSYKQLDEFEKVYRSIIDKFVQKKYTRKERKAQADAGYLYCITDESASIYAIAIKACVHGGAYGSRSDCQNNIYAPILVLYLFKDFYDNMPNNPVKEKEYMQSKGIGGWIAVDNIPSWRVYKMVGIKAAAKSMNQFIIRTTM